MVLHNLNGDMVPFNLWWWFMGMVYGFFPYKLAHVGSPGLPGSKASDEVTRGPGSRLGMAPNMGKTPTDIQSDGHETCHWTDRIW